MTVWRVKGGQLGFKLYDKTMTLLRVEVTAHKVAALRCGRGLDKAGVIIERLHRHTASFLNTLSAAHLRTLEDGVFEELPNPSVRGARRIAGVDLNKECMRTVCAAVGALALDPRGFRLAELAARITAQQREHRFGESIAYTKKQASYDLRKLRAKELVDRIERTHRYRVRGSGLRVISGALCLRRCVLRPVLAGLAQRGAPPPPDAGATRLDQWQLLVQGVLHGLLGELGLAA